MSKNYIYKKHSKLSYLCKLNEYRFLLYLIPKIETKVLHIIEYLL